MFINSDHKILEQNEIIEKLRLEIVSLTQEKDNLISWNTELIRWKTETVNITESKTQELYTIESIIEETQKTLDKNSIHFHNLTDKQKSKLQELSIAIQDRLDELAIQEGKELIDIDSENRKIKKELTIARKELQTMLDDAKLLRNERIAFEKEKNDIRQAINEERAKYIDYMASLEKREQKIVLSEKRLEKYKEELLSKK